MGRARARGSTSLAFALVVLALGAVGSQAALATHAEQVLPPESFANAVFARLKLFPGVVLDVRPAVTFKQLQADVAAVATSGDVFVVDPQTGNPWSLPTLLEQASSLPSQMTWLGASASSEERMDQIKRVLALMVWRPGSYPGNDQESGVTRTAYAHSADCPITVGGYTPSADLMGTWGQLLPQAVAAKSTTSFGGGYVASVAAGWSVQGGDFSGSQIAGPVASVLVTRDLWKLVPNPDAPFPGVPVDAGRIVFAETPYQDNGSQRIQQGLLPLGVVATSVATDRQFSLSDFDLAGTSLGRASTVPIPNSRRYGGSGTFTTAYDVPLNVMLGPGSSEKQPKLAQALMLRINEEEPPTGFPPAGPLAGSCLWARSTDIGPSNENGSFVAPGSPMLIYREVLPPLVARGTARISGLLRDVKGKSIAGAKIAVTGSNFGPPYQTTVTDAKGHYAFDNLSPGRHEVFPQNHPGQPRGGTFVPEGCSPGPGIVANRQNCILSLTDGGVGTADFLYRLPELVAEQLEVTQGIQTNVWDKPGRFEIPRVGKAVPGGKYAGVPLVEGVRTVVRLYAYASANLQAEPVSGVPALLHAYRRSSTGALHELPGSPIEPLDVATRTLKVGPSLPAARTDPAGAYTFDLPGAWTHTGAVTLVGELDPPPRGGSSGSDDSERPIAECGGCEESSSFALDAISFHAVRKIVLTPVQITYRYPGVGGVQVGPDLTPLLQRAARQVLPLRPGLLAIDPYPASVVDITGSVRALKKKWHLSRADLGDCLTVAPNASGQTCRSDYNVAVLGAIADAAAAMGIETGTTTRHFVIGYTSADIGAATYAYRGISALDVERPPRPLTSDAHELFHLLGFPHASACGTAGTGQTGEKWPPDEQGYIQGIGLDRKPGSGGAAGPYKIIAPGVGQPQWFDFMSYCTGATDVRAWISTRNWTRFVEGSATANGEAEYNTVAPEPALTVDASVQPDGRITISGVSHRTLSFVTRSDPSAPYRIVVKNADGHTISSTGVAVEPIEDGGGSLITADVPAAGATQVDIMRGGKAVASSGQSANPPKVTIVAPRPGARLNRGRKTIVRWQVQGGTPSDQTAEIDFSSDNGRHWRPLALGLLGGEASLPGKLLSSGQKARLRVVVNDGFDDVSATTGPLRVEGPKRR